MKSSGQRQHPGNPKEKGRISTSGLHQLEQSLGGTHGIHLTSWLALGTGQFVLILPLPVRFNAPGNAQELLLP